MSQSRTSRLSKPVTDRDHILGSANAPSTLVEYGDYECPHCGRAHPIVKEVRKILGDRLRFVFRNFPLSQMHPHAEMAAEAAEAAGDQGKFWEMHDLLFEHQQNLDTAHLLQSARQLGLDQASFERALTDHAYAARVHEDLLSGARSGVNGTPTFYINGYRHDGNYDLDSLVEAIRSADA